jgi:chromosome segregation ATPase
LPRSTAIEAPASSLPIVRLEVRAGNGRPTIYEVGDGGFLIGSVPGCDLRLPGANLAPVLCLIARHASGASLRKLVPVQPVIVNGRAVSSVYLADGDRVSLGAAEILVSITAPAAPPAPANPPPDLEERLREVETREREILEANEQLETDRIIWYKRREEIETEIKRHTEVAEDLNRRLRQEERDLTAARVDLERREQEWRDGQEELARQRLEIAEMREGSVKQQEEAVALRRELAHIRQQLYQRYQEKRDRLAGLHQAVRRAAKRLQERKRKFDEEAKRIETSRQEWSLREAELESRAEQTERERKLLEDQAQLIAGRQQELQKELHDRLEEVQDRERQLADERLALEKSTRQHQTDLVRLDRIQATLDQRQKQLQAQALEVDRRFEQLQRDARDLEEQATQLDEWHNRLAGETEGLAKQKQEQETVAASLDQRAAALEGQQAMLATLRTRLERMREDLRRQEQALSDQRAMQEASEADLKERVEEAKKLREELDNDKQLFEEERRRFEERRTTMEAAVAQLRAAQESLSAEEEKLREREKNLDAVAADQAEQAGLLVARADQMKELHEKLTADRQALRDREATLAKAEQALAALQEQLRKRSEELNERQRQQAEQERKLQQDVASQEVRRLATEQEQQKETERLTAFGEELTSRARELERIRGDLDRREEALRAEAERLEEAQRALANMRQALANERITFEVERQGAAETAARTRAEFETAKKEALDLGRQLPELEGRAAAALERLARGRDQLREHLAEVHTYARQSREDLEAARKHLQAEIERVRQQELDLHVARDEHRLAVAAFRQQLIEWQGQVGEMKQTLLRGESRLERRQAEVEEQVQQIATTSARLAQQAEQLQEQERQVAERRGEVDRHLTDMREWYRRKMRELSGIDAPESSGGREEGESVVVPLATGAGQPTDAELESPASERGILALTGEIDPGDRQLGDWLRSLELIDAETLTALLVEARRQRRSLRQLLLAGNYLTLYQMALIEAGNVEGLVLGPVRVIDRLQATAHEAVYRVFDPRRNGEALLRHLAESEMHDAVRPDEFRQRFAAAAAVQHPNVAATLEVLELGGRPAALQEWLIGLPGTEWPALAAAPGVWFRLLSQAALGLQTAHAAGLVHGHLSAASFVLTAEGILKIRGLGEPPWLAIPAEAGDREATAEADLASLGAVAASWAAVSAPRKGAKPKPLPEELQAILARLTAENPAERYPSAAALLADLDRAGSAVPANNTAWERFVRQVREQSADTALRESA